MEWTGFEGLWTDTANWSGGVVPGAGDTVNITAGGIVNLYTEAEIDSLNLAAGKLKLGSVGILTTGAQGVLLSGGGTLEIGYGAGAINAPTIDAADLGYLNFTNNDDYTLSSDVTGNLHLTHNGSGITTLTGTNTYTGSTTVDGGGTLVITGESNNGAGYYAIGESHNGSLIIAEGGSVSNGNTVIGFSMGTTGTATVTGEGSSWTNSGALYVGRGSASTGTLTIEDGGTVNSINTYIGDDSAASGTVTVTGEGSSWTNGGVLYVGNSGNGWLTIAEGGKVVVEGGNKVTLAGSVEAVGTLTIGAAAGSAAVGAGTLEAAEVYFGSGTGRINFNHTDTAYTFAPNITGEGTVNHFAGTTILTGTNTFTGPIVLQGGVLQVSKDSNLGYAGNALTFTGGTLRTTADFSMNRTFTLSSDGTIDVVSGTLVQGGGIFGSGGLIKQGSGTLSLTGSNTYTGGTTISGGVLEISWDNLGDASGGLVLDGGTLRTTAIFSMNRATTLASDGTFDVETGTLVHEGEISGSGGLIKLGDGTLWLTGTNTYTGGTTISGGVLEVSENSNLGAASGALVFDGGTLHTTAGFTMNRATTLTSSGTFDVETATLFHEGEISGSGMLIKQGGGTLSLTGTNTYTGGTTISGGVLEVSENSNLGAASGALVFDGGTLRTTAGFTMDRATTLASDGTFYVFSGSLVHEGDITGSGGLIKQGGGTLSLTGTNTYTGGTTISDGVLEVSENSNLGAASGGLVFDGGTLRTTAGFTMDRATTLTSSGTFDVVTGTLVHEGDITGPSSFTKLGDGTLLLTGTNTYAGNTYVYRGTLAITGTSDHGSTGYYYIGQNSGAIGRLTITEGGTVFAAGASIGNISGAIGQITVSDSGSSLNIDNLLGIGNFGQGTLLVEAGGSVSSDYGSVGTQFASSGTATVTGAGSNWSITTALSIGESGTGTLTIANGGRVNVASGAGVLNIAQNGGSSGTLNIGAAAGSAAVGAGTLEAAEVRFRSGTGTLNFNHTDTGYTFAPNITGTGALKHHAGTTILTGANTYIGTTTVHGGTLIIQGASDQGTADYFIGQNSGDVGRLTIAEGGTVSAEGASIGNNNGAIGEVTVSDSGSSWNVATELEIGKFGQGTLLVEAGGSVSSNYGTVGMQSGANGTATVTGAGSTWSNSMALTLGLDGAGTLTIEDGGSVTTTHGNLAGTSLGTGTVTVTGSGSAWTNSNVLSVGMEGAATLTVEAGGSVSNADGYIGRYFGSIGTATVTGDGSAWTNSSKLYVGWDGTGALTIADGGRVNVASGTGFIDVAFGSDSSGTLTIGAAAGSAAVGAGTLEAAEVRFGSGTGTLNFNHTDTGYTFAPNITGAGALDHLAGTTVLTGDNSGFTGTASVRGGTLAVNSALGAATTVTGSGTLTGTGSIAAAVGVTAGGTLAGVQGRTLSLQSLSLDSGAVVAAALGAPDASGPLFAVTDDLVLDGTLHITDLGGLSAGVYNLASYGGTLTDNGLEIGALPTGMSAADFAVQTSVAGKINLISAAGAELRFWDGGDAALHGNGRIDGGAGRWRADGTTWTDATGSAAGTMRPVPAFAVFDGTGGVVTLDNSAGTVSATGLQFATDGYRLTGDALELDGADGQSIVRVGDGSAGGAGYTATIAAALTGKTRLVKTDLGTLVLTGANSYTGGTEVRGGTLVGNVASIRGDLVNNATVVFNEAGAATFAGAISGTGTTVKQGAGVLTLTGTSSTDWHIEKGGLVASSERFTGDLLIDAGATVTFEAAKDGVYTGRLSGAGSVLFTGGGTLQLTGATAGFAGTTTADTGTLVMDGRMAGRLLLGAAARLEGNGTLGDAELSGTLAPGHSIGKLTFTGDVTLASTAVYEVEVDATGASDLIAVAGKATLKGSTLAVLAAEGDYQPETRYTILTAAQGLTGEFGDVTTNLAFLTPSLDYAGTKVTLTLSRNQTDFAAVAATANQRSVAAAVQSLGAASPLYGAVVPLDAAGARQAFDQLSGEGHASLAGMLLDDTRLVRDAILARVPAEAGLWSTVLGTWSETDGNGNAAGHKRSARGFQMGVDREAGEHVRLGLSFGYLNRDLTTDRGFSAEVDSYTFGAYAAGRYGRLSVAVGTVASWHKADTERAVAFGSLAETVRGDYDANGVQAFAELGWQATQRGVALTPYARLAHAALDVDGFREEGGAAALAGDRSDLHATFAELGLRAASAAPLDLGGAQLTLHASAGVRRALGGVTPVLDARFGETAAFSAAGVPLVRTVATADLGARARLGERLSLDLSYAGQHVGRTNDHGVRVSASWKL